MGLDRLFYKLRIIIHFLSAFGWQEDNGVKLVDPMGEMLTATWEGFATQLANTEQEELLTALTDIIEKEGIDMSQKANVFVGKDTRYIILTPQTSDY